MIESELTEKIIGCAMDVHRELGPGLLESIYEAALCIELKARGIHYDRQKALPVMYKGELLGEFRVDLLAEDTVVLEIKSVERHDPLFEAQLLSYLKLGGYHVGLLINFNSSLLKTGIRRMVL
jgi:GxxExxY protein